MRCARTSKRSGMWTDRSRAFVRWAVKSAVGLGINLALLTVWVDGFGIWPEVAVLINWVLLSVYGYVVSRRWVFEETVALSGVWDHARQYLGMQGILATSKVVNYLVYVGLLRVTEFYQAAWVVGAAVGLLVSFGGNWEWWTPSETDVD